MLANAGLYLTPPLSLLCKAIEDDGVLANVNARSAQLVSGLEALRSKREGVIAEVP